jgi:hypothetical protein
MQVATLLKEAINNLNLKLNVYAVVLVDGNYKAYCDSTHYIKDKMSVVLDGVSYKVVSFELNKTVTLKGSAAISVKSYNLESPFFTHGKLKAVNDELSQAGRKVKISPFIWMFELQPRTRPSEVDTVLDSTGSVKLFFMADSDFKNYTTAEHYKQVIDPMNNLVNSFINSLKDNKRTGLVFETLRLNHAKFTTGGGETASDERSVLGRYLSGIELEITIPIMMDFLCKTRNYPKIDGASFNSGFNAGFKI